MKPLEWEAKPAGTRPGFYAESAFGRYLVREVEEGWAWYCGMSWMGIKGSEAEAKAFAQADHEACVLACLEPAPAPDLRAAARWQPIETAPKDGTKIDLWRGGDACGGERWADMFWHSGMWSRHDHGKVWHFGPVHFTHWSPIDQGDGSGLPPGWRPTPALAGEPTP